MAETNPIYSLFNLSIKSDIPFIGIPTTKKNPNIILNEDLTLERKSKKNSFQELSLVKGWIENKELIAEISPDSINYKFLKNLDAHTKQTKLLHQTMPSILFQNKYLVLHAAAFIYNDFGVLLCGPSSYGKSETINKLSKEFKIISDDIVGLKIEGDDINILPGLTFTSIQNGEEKFRLKDKRNRYFKVFNEDDIYNQNITLEKVIILDWGNNFIYKTIRKQDAFKKVMANSFRPIPSSHCLESEKKHFQNLTALIKNSDQYVFIRKRGEIDNSIKSLIENL